MKKLPFLLSTLAFITLAPLAYADQPVPLSSNYAFGYIGSVGEGFSHLVVPGFAVAGLLVTIYMVLGAFRYLTAMGDKEDAKAGRERITHAIVGYIILIIIFLGLKFLPSAFGLTGVEIIK